jgi:hypothetical protein
MRVRGSAGNHPRSTDKPLGVTGASVRLPVSSWMPDQGQSSGRFAHPAFTGFRRLRRKPCFLRRSWITPPQPANSKAVRIPRPVKTRQVIKNQLSDTTQRRSRDLAPGIFLQPVTATRHFSMRSIPCGVPQSNFSRRKITLRYAYAAGTQIQNAMSAPPAERVVGSAEVASFSFPRGS